MYVQIENCFTAAYKMHRGAKNASFSSAVVFIRCLENGFLSVFLSHACLRKAFWEKCINLLPLESVAHMAVQKMASFVHSQSEPLGTWHAPITPHIIFASCYRYTLKTFSHTLSLHFSFSFLTYIRRYGTYVCSNVRTFVQ